MAAYIVRDRNKKARTSDEINSYIATAKAIGRREMKAIHLHAADFERVKRNPPRYDCTEGRNGRIMTVFNSRMIEVVGVQ